MSRGDVFSSREEKEGALKHESSPKALSSLWAHPQHFSRDCLSLAMRAAAVPLALPTLLFLGSALFSRGARLFLSPDLGELLILLPA